MTNSVKAVSVKKKEKYLRMTLNERMQHFFLLTSFITLVITGFALKFPESLWVTAFRNLIGEGAFDFRGDLHRIAAVVMTLDSLYHIGYVIFNVRGRKLIKDLWFKPSDISDLKNAFRYYTGKSKERPRYGRFSYIEKAEYWALVWGNVVMGVTGVFLWFENLFLPVISNYGMDIATAVHYYEAILATLAIIVWHFYFVIYNPEIYPMNKAWITGYITRHQMEVEHPLELAELEKKMAEGVKPVIIENMIDPDSVAEKEDSEDKKDPEKTHMKIDDNKAKGKEKKI